ncbi:MAG TPA: hypothetical protein VKD72_30725, partial [Gemmataceae bacterium]|nr:hypothetical protein [Gemmataceae bacterium]
MLSMKTDRRTTNSAAMWGRSIQFEEELSPVAARALLKFRFSQLDRARMDALVAKARAGALTPRE